MFFKNRNTPTRQTSEAEAVHAALDKVQAMIWFEPDGTILKANENFLNAVGYSLDEVEGKHHRIFMAAEMAESPEYKAFWAKLAAGEALTGEFPRIHKDGHTVYIEASYNPIFGPDGRVEKVVKFAIDVTAKKRASADAAGQLEAISRSQAVIEFEPDGTILTANENFLSGLRYTLDEVQGQHHRMFCDPAYANSREYKAFWEKLGRGEFASGEFKRFTKTGDGIWIQASYNPIFDPEGRPYKVVKYATDITEAKLKSADYEGQIKAVSRSQAVIEFDLDGTIRTANENFLATTGYRLDEIQGQHHRMFCEEDYAASAEYRTFWEDLARGEFASGEFRRLAKNGSTVWIQASYNPIFDPEGKPYKVVKYATDITAWKTELQLIIDSLIALSKGDLTQRLPSEGSHDLEDMRAAFNTTLDKLGELVDDINFASASIQEESESIADSAQSLSSRCERQAATVEETSASMEEMASTVKSNAKNAENATAAAKNATEHAENGGGIVQEAIAAMVKIEEGSAEVRKIIEVIDAIAFQTNLLALNAGVEAARAGEAGSGFAVVASEVRALAQRASESARDISKLIESSERQVEEGAGLVKKTGEALTEIVSSVTMVSTGIDEIYTASSEQATGVNEINHAMTDIDSTTQKTAAISEESTAAAASLAQRSNALRDLVGFFKTGSKPRDPGRARTEAPAAVSAPDEEATPAAPPVTGQLALAAADEPEDWREF